MDNIIKDFGDIKLPTSWDEVSLKTFQEIERYYDGDENRDINYRDLLHIFTDKTEDEINELPMDFLHTMLLHLQFLNEKPSIEEPTNKITINGEEYIVNNMEQLKFGEFTDAQMILNSDKHNIAAILGIICRKKGEKYDSKFIADTLDSRIEMFENAPITKVMSLIQFFFHLYLTLEIPTQLSLAIQEEIGHIRQHITNSNESGHGSTYNIKSVKKTLKKLEKRLKSISQT